MNILTLEMNWLAYSLVAIYVVPGTIAGIMYMFPTRRDLAAKRSVERKQRSYLATT